MTRTREKGQAAAELALVLPLLAIILLGCFDLGRLFWVRATLVNAAREGARYGSLFPTDQSGIVSRTQTEAGAGGLASGGVTVGVSYGPKGPVAGSAVIVTADYSLQPITTMLFGSGPYQVSAQVQMVIMPGGE